MAFRFRRSIRFGPLRLNFSKNGASSLSLGGPGATLNVPINRPGPARATVGIPGTGLSWTEPVGPRPSAAQRRQIQQTQQGAPAGITTTQEAVEVLKDSLVGPASLGQTLWHQHGVGLVKTLMQRDDTPRAVLEACALVETWDRCELHVRRGRGHADTIRRARQVAEAVQLVLNHGRQIGIVTD